MWRRFGVGFQTARLFTDESGKRGLWHWEPGVSHPRTPVLRPSSSRPHDLGLLLGGAVTAAASSVWGLIPPFSLSCLWSSAPIPSLPLHLGLHSLSPPSHSWSHKVHPLGSSCTLFASKEKQKREEPARLYGWVQMERASSFCGCAGLGTQSGPLGTPGQTSRTPAPSAMARQGLSVGRVVGRAARKRALGLVGSPGREHGGRRAVVTA